MLWRNPSNTASTSRGSVSSPHSFREISPRLAMAAPTALTPLQVAEITKAFSICDTVRGFPTSSLFCMRYLPFSFDPSLPRL